MKERRRQGRNQDLHKDSAQIAPQKRIFAQIALQRRETGVAKNCAKGKT